LAYQLSFMNFLFYSLLAAAELKPRSKLIPLIIYGTAILY